MVSLFTWFPSTPLEVIELAMLPDLGHSSLQVVDDPLPETYISFWPDPNTLVGEFTHHFKPPPARDPSMYTDEIDPNGHYMRRPADENDRIEGLDESRIVSAWEFLSGAQYDLLRWNCSDLTKFLILHAMNVRYYTHLQEAASLSLADMGKISSFQDARAIIRYLASRSFIDTRPDDVVHLVRVYNRVKAAEKVKGTAT